jgi:Uma2 family endonuclease
MMTLIPMGGAKLSRVSLPLSRRAEHIMGMPAQIQRHWTAEDVRALMDESRHWPRYELLGGELIVTPAPDISHQVAVTELLRLLADYCDRENIGVALMSPSDIELVQGWITQPDLFVVPRSVLPAGDERMTWKRVDALLLAIEVLSPSSVRTDRVEKRDHYLANGVAEYWIVDLDARLVEQWHPERATPRLTRSTLTWRPAGATSDLLIDLPRLFVDVRDKLRRS